MTRLKPTAHRENTIFVDLSLKKIAQLSMIAVLNEPAIRARAAAISPEAYHLMTERGLISERTELIEGVR